MPLLSPHHRLSRPAFGRHTRLIVNLLGIAAMSLAVWMILTGAGWWISTAFILAWGAMSLLDLIRMARRRRRPRRSSLTPPLPHEACTRCAYPLRGTGSSRCPECGAFVAEVEHAAPMSERL